MSAIMTPWQSPLCVSDAGAGRAARRWILALLMTVVAALSLGCGDSAEDSGDVVDSGPREGYPAAPYGVTENAIIEDLTFLSPDGSDFSLQSVYADGNNRLLLITTAAGWCTACIEEQPWLEQLYGEYSGRGLAILVAVFEDANFNAATPELAGEWAENHAVTFPVVADPEFLFEPYYDATSTPMNMIVDVTSMEILWVVSGGDKTTVESILSARL